MTLQGFREGTGVHDPLSFGEKQRQQSFNY